MRSSWVGVFLLVALRCGDDSETHGPPPRPDASTECRAGEVRSAAGECTFLAGIDPDQCGEGFQAEDERSCREVLPASCPKGQMAIPGETACRAVGACGDGDYGDVPADAATQFVAQAYAGGANDGTQAHPWTTIQEAIDHATPGAIVAIAAGSYEEGVVIQDHGVRLWGRCPELVEIVGSVAKTGAVRVFPGVAGAEVRGIALRGVGIGIAYSGVTDLLLDQLWIHDMDFRGIAMAPYPASPSTTRLSRSLVESTTEVGVFFTESLTIEESVIRGTRSDPVFAGGNGIMVQDDGQLQLLRSVVEENLEFGVYVLGSTAEVESSVLRNTKPQPTTKEYGLGLIDAKNMDGKRATVTIRSSVVAANASVGIGVVDSDLTLETSVVRDTGLSSGVEARGATVKSTASVFDSNPVAGLRFTGSQADIEGAFVRGNVGYGVLAEESTVAVRSSRIEHNRVAGTYLLHSQGTLEGVSFLDTTSDPDFNGGGDALTVESESGGPASASLTHAYLTSNARAGATSFGSAISLSDVELRCNAVDFDGESDYSSETGQPFSFDEAGAVRCSCDDKAYNCLVQTSHIGPPIIP